MSTLALIHTTPVTVGTMKALTAARAPDVRVINLLDDSLLPDVMTAGGLTPDVTQRLGAYARAAVNAGAQAVMCCCSSVGDAVEALRPGLPVPFLRIDDPMADQAAQLGARVGVIATLPTTLTPTANLIERAAARAGRAVQVERTLVSGAYDALMAGDAGRHDQLVAAALRDLAARTDVIVLAQASMARLLGALTDIRTPVLSSPESGLAAALKALP